MVWMPRLATLCLMAIAASWPHVAQPRSSANDEEVRGLLNSFSYGYSVHAAINGHDTGLEGNSSENLLLVFEGSREARLMAPDVRARAAVLHAGRNMITIRYTRLAGSSPDLKLSLEIDGYAVPVVFAHVGLATSGVLEGAFDIGPSPPPTYHPLVLSDAPSGTVGFIHFDQGRPGTATIELSLNGDDLGSYVNMARDTVPMTGLRPGANTLRVKYGAPKKPVHMVVVGPSDVQIHVLDSRTTTQVDYNVTGLPVVARNAGCRSAARDRREDPVLRRSGDARPDGVGNHL